MASQVMRITLKAYDHQLVDASAKKIIETVKKNGSQVSGPVPLPTKKEVVTILRAVHKYKYSREQFEQRTHKRLIDIITLSVMCTPFTDQHFITVFQNIQCLYSVYHCFQIRCV